MIYDILSHRLQSESLADFLDARAGDSESHGQPGRARTRRLGLLVRHSDNESIAVRGRAPAGLGLALTVMSPVEDI